MSRILIKCLQPIWSSDLSWRPLSWLSARWCTPAPSGSLCSSPPECVTKLIWTNFNRILTFELQSSSLLHSSSCFMGGILRLRRNGPQVWRIKISLFTIYSCLYPPWLACRPPYNHRDSHKVCLINEKSLIHSFWSKRVLTCFKSQDWDLLGCPALAPVTCQISSTVTASQDSGDHEGGQGHQGHQQHGHHVELGWHVPVSESGTDIYRFLCPVNTSYIHFLIIGAPLLIILPSSKALNKNLLSDSRYWQSDSLVPIYKDQQAM